jgi:phosphatidylserine/phosphatidylglycerophosphate/cardiolipin synthase-like enzyme
MVDPIKRTQTILVDEKRGRSSSSSQWLLEQKTDSHPICDNSKLTVFICGEEGFSDIAKELEAAKESIDICFWGFDPGMELVRGSGVWPRGQTFGDLLIAAGKRKGMAVRLLVWYDPYGDKVDLSNPRNMPGYTHDVDKFRDDLRNVEVAKHLSAASVIALSSAYWSKMKKKAPKINFSAEQLSVNARRDYCNAWYWAAFNGHLKGIELRTRAGNTHAVKKSGGGKLRELDRFSAERNILERAGTHHQKPLLIDFNYDQGSKAVGYVMGLNSVTDYWDTANHIFEDSRREREGVRTYEPDLKHSTMKPLRDYACRIDRGRALLPLYQNFVKAWEREDPDQSKQKKSELGSRPMPAHCLARAPAGSPTVQILRTQPDEGDKTIQDLYFNATDLATRASGYLYVENQYFQWEEWAQRLLQVRKKSMQQWNASRVAAGLPLEKMPILHVFIVIPVPEREEMIPRTYDTLATLGEQAHMSGQAMLIKNKNENRRTIRVADGSGPAVTIQEPLPEVVQYANQISSPNTMMLESQFGIKVCTAMLNSCGSNGTDFSYREIYIHSKLLLIDDIFFTLGSANMNLRSMAVDSEINVATVDPGNAKKLRKRIWEQLTGKRNATGNGGDGSYPAIADAFDDWLDTMANNRQIKAVGSEPIVGFLLPLEDARSSASRLG